MKVNVEETGLETYSYFVPCENSCHDECENSHQSALDKATEMNCGSSNREKLTICRYLQSVVNIFINKVIAKNSEFYDTHLLFSQDGSVHLEQTSLESKPMISTFFQRFIEIQSFWIIYFKATKEQK